MSREFENEIVKLRQQGLTYSQIQEKLECSKSTISYYCKKLGIEINHSSKKIDDDEIIEMQKLYDELGSCDKVAKKIGRSKVTVSKYVQLKQVEISDGDKRKRRSENVINWRKRTKLRLVEYKGGKCQCCGYNKCIEAMEFHHLDSKEKDFAISGKSLSFDRMKKEVDKCILVCSNCHKEIHAGIRKI